MHERPLGQGARRARTAAPRPARSLAPVAGRPDASYLRAMTGVSSIPVTAAGLMLRQWRQRRRLSQLDLSLATRVSARRLSYVETARSRPSRGGCCDSPTSSRCRCANANELLVAAGLAPVFGQRDLDDPEMRPVRDALQAILIGHEPHPALAVDRHREMVAANRARRAHRRRRPRTARTPHQRAAPRAAPRRDAPHRGQLRRVARAPARAPGPPGAPDRRRAARLPARRADQLPGRHRPRTSPARRAGRTRRPPPRSPSCRRAAVPEHRPSRPSGPSGRDGRIARRGRCSVIGNGSDRRGLRHGPVAADSGRGDGIVGRVLIVPVALTLPAAPSVPAVARSGA